MGLFRTFGRRQGRPEKKARLQDVWIAARLASNHTAGTHSILATLLTISDKQRAELEYLRAAVDRIESKVDAARPISVKASPAAMTSAVSTVPTTVHYELRGGT